MHGYQILKYNITYHCSKKMKYLNVNLTKNVQDLYVEKYITPMKEIKDDLNISLERNTVVWKTLHSEDVDAPQIDKQV